MGFSQKETPFDVPTIDTGDEILTPDDWYLENNSVSSKGDTRLPADVLQLFNKGAFSFWQWNRDTNDLSVQGALQADSIEEWMSRVHPREQAAFSRFLDEKAASNRAPRIIEYRFRIDRGSQWVPVRQTAVETGERLSTLSCLVENIQHSENDETRLDALENQFKAAEKRIHRIIGEVIQTSGEHFFENLSSGLLEALNAQAVSVYQVAPVARELFLLGSSSSLDEWEIELESLNFTLADEMIRSGQTFQSPVSENLITLKTPIEDPEGCLALRLVSNKSGTICGLIAIRWEHTIEPDHLALVELLLSLGATVSRAEISRLAEAKNHRETEKLLRQSQKMEDVGRLSGGMAHDFNNLLTVIQGHVGILQSKLESPELDETIRESIDTIHTAASHAAELTSQLLVFSRSQCLEFTIIDLNRVTRDFARMLRRMIEETIDLQLKIPEREFPVEGDKGMLGQIILNLVVNARDSMPDGGSITIETGTEKCEGDNAPAPRPGEYAYIEVTDTGIGISAANIDRIFEPFYTTKTAGNGTGIGLSSVRNILEQHAGFIEVSSEVGKGSKFKVYLPMTQEKHISTNVPEAEGRKTSSLSKATILLVEDDKAVRRMVRKLLEMQGAIVHEAVSGKDAIDRWPEIADSITLVMTDIVMPDGVSGWELAEALSQENPKLPILLTSGYNEDPADHPFPEGAPIKFLQKPFEIENLRKTLESLLS